MIIRSIESYIGTSKIFVFAYIEYKTHRYLKIHPNTAYPLEQLAVLNYSPVSISYP